MDLTKTSDTCIVSVGKGGWYHKGVARLEHSLIYHGYTGHTKFWKHEVPVGSPEHSENPYAFKIYAIQAAIDAGYKKVIWLDSSAWCIRDPQPLLNIINDRGYYFWSSGHNLAQTASDKCLEYFGINRDTAETFEDISSGFVGLDLSQDQACASMVINKMGLFIDRPNILCGYYDANMNDSVIFAYRGM